jgi:lipoprotein-releasing system ATP-binding protein
MSEPLVELRGVCKDYGEEVRTRVLHDVDLRVDPGEFACIVGPSGSGKSTLLNLIGLLDRPSAGSLRLLGHDVATLDEDALTALRGRGLGFVFQFHHLIGALSAVENVMAPLAIAHGSTGDELLGRAREALTWVGLGERADALPRQLSGGEQQRVAIARAMVTRPPLVLADEPTGNLDSGTSAVVFELMRRLNRELEMAFLIVTHDPRVSEQTDRQIHVVDGRVSG